MAYDRVLLPALKEKRPKKTRGSPVVSALKKKKESSTFLFALFGPSKHQFKIFLSLTLKICSLLEFRREKYQPQEGIKHKICVMHTLKN